MKHKDCGGEIRTDWSLRYPGTNDDGSPRMDYGLRCTKCEKEIEGGAEIEATEDGPDEYTYPLSRAD